MSQLTLSLALSQNSRTEPLLRGQIAPNGIELIPTPVHPSEMFWRQLHFGDFDVSEMSMASLMVLVDRDGGVRDWVPIPVFTSRRFFHTDVMVRTGSGIERPSDLRGKRVGVPEYQQTAAVWARGVLEEHYEVKPSDVDWFMERGGKLSHASSTGFQPPDGVRITHIDPESSIERMLLDGELDATLLYLRERNLIDRSRRDLRENSAIQPLFADPGGEATRFFESTGLFPLNHAVVVRRSIAERHPWVVLNLFHAFTQAKEAALSAAEGTMREFQIPAPAGVARSPIVHEYPYGVRANRDVLETLGRYACEQGLTSRLVNVDEIFDERTQEL